MKVLIQGMRRSGTTILYDLLCADPAFAGTFYEPLGIATKLAIGGGSGLRDVDLSESVRQSRDAFARLHPELEDVALLNYGAPRDWRLEFERHLPPLVDAYLRFLLEQADDVLVKFTRMACKLEALAALAPEAPLIHVVRDPRAVTTSYLFGKRHARRAQVEDPDAFFGAVSDWSAWSSREFSDHLLARPEYAGRGPWRDFERILVLWRHNFEETIRGAAAFGDRYLLCRHEDLLADPGATIDRLYAFIGRDAPPAVRALATASVRPEQAIVAPEDPRWEEGLRRAGLRDALWREPVPSRPAPRGPSRP
jgi:hypothetical protein